MKKRRLACQLPRAAVQDCCLCQAHSATRRLHWPLEQRPTLPRVRRRPESRLKARATARQVGEDSLEQRRVAAAVLPDAEASYAENWPAE